MPKLFEETFLGRIHLKNRFVRSATWEGLAESNGRVTADLVDRMKELARNEVGLIISGHAYVSPEGQAGMRQLGIYSDDLLPGLKEMTEAVHSQGGRIVLQAAHAGGRAAVKLSGLEAVGPSSSSAMSCRELKREEINRIVESFGLAAARAKTAGFDGVQIHAAHGYLISQFLSPFYNRRSDDYGGSLENRARLLLDVLKEMRRATGPDYTITVKLNSEDFLDGGFTLEEMLRTAEWLEKAGIDAIELSGGTGDSGKRIPVRPGRIKTEDQEVFYLEAARRYKERVNTPLVLVGGIRSHTVAERLVTDKIADYISLSRPLIRRPDLIAHWKKGDFIRSDCRSCNLCFKPASGGEGLYCYAKEKMGK